MTSDGAKGRNCVVSNVVTAGTYSGALINLTVACSLKTNLTRDVVEDTQLC